MHHEFSEVAHVDESHRIVSMAGSKNFTAARKAHRPIGKTIGRVAWPDDIRWPHDDRAIAEYLDRLTFTLRFRDAERRRSVLGIVSVVAYRRRLIEPALKVRVIHARRRREQIRAGRILEELCRHRHP